ncbi:hypothetical protein BEL07_25500 [Mycolicibacterium grossiae]|uniref:Uncharacterized protein n=1 Tax=Mycolicibacterium grossiae TaxID=1552759 RepID=A0A1E8PXF7_9MYCO|nr:hypothetical protein [Mycolicibacterium grossiae]OFJ50925.1 hypothetical protein BEL07_25500 [Mycolicibacterium grossiae]
MAEIEQVEREERTVEERLENAEKRIARLDREVKELWYFVVALMGLGVVAVVIWSLWPAPQPSNRDATEQELLSEGVHCYDSSEERAAARQRALAAVERMQWQQDHLVEQAREDSTPMVPVLPPALSIPSIVDTAPSSSEESWDGALCFSVEYMP